MPPPDSAKHIWSKPPVVADVTLVRCSGQHDVLAKVHCFGDLSSAAADFRHGTTRLGNDFSRPPMVER